MFRLITLTSDALDLAALTRQLRLADSAPDSSNSSHNSSHIHTDHSHGDEPCSDARDSFTPGGTIGALSSFVGITRGHVIVDGVRKKVLTLDYEAYAPMAIAELHKIVDISVSRWPTLSGVIIAHRLGRVPVGEDSVIILASSPHRRESLDAVSYLIDELKRKVPIWKREVYENGSIWKANTECGCIS